MFAKVSTRVATAVALSLSLIAVLAFSMPAAAQNKYRRTNLQSDIPGVALRADSNLVNPWGVAFSSGGPIWIADNGTGVSEVFFGSGLPFPQPTPLVVTIPPPVGSTGPSSPTGIVFNGGGFNVTQSGVTGSSIFIFDTEDGTISGWAPGVNALNAVKVIDNSVPEGVDDTELGAVYKGLALGQVGSKTFLYATNFRDGVIEMYDSNFTFKKFFTDPNIKKDATNPGFAPFGIANIGGTLWVTFAMQNASRHDSVAGAGLGFVDVFDTTGAFLGQFATGGTLNAPWGQAVAPANFGQFSNAFLVGNFGDGRINAFDLGSGAFLGQLNDTVGNPLTIDRLWALVFGNGATAGKTDSLIFTAGIGAEMHGLWGTIRAQ